MKASEAPLRLLCTSCLHMQSMSNLCQKLKKKSKTVHMATMTLKIHTNSTHGLSMFDTPKLCLNRTLTTFDELQLHVPI